MTEQQQLFAKLMEETRLTKDQCEVLNKYFNGSGRVCVDAGAGTGKTTTLIEILSFIVLLEHKNDEKNNPFEKILVISFTKEASRQLKVKLKQKLYELENQLNLEVNEDIYRWIETESFIQTIDSYLQILLKEISLNISLNPLFEVSPLIEIDNIIAEIEEEMRTNKKYQKIIENLEDIFPEFDFGFKQIPGLFEMLTTIHQKSREFCWKQEDYSEKFDKTLSMMFCDKNPPFENNDVIEIITNLTNENNSDTLEQLSNDELKILKRGITHTFEEMKKRYHQISSLLDEYDELYTKKTKKTGHLTYVDIAYMIWKYIEENPNINWVKSLKLKFNHLLIDEFQDTSYVQCKIISELIREGKNKEDKNQIMIIGDVKQSIYQWRSAEPKIFSQIIAYAKGQTKELLCPFKMKDAEYVALTSNFRSQPSIIYFVNDLFSNAFENEKTGRIGKTKVDYVPIKPKREINSSNENNIHTILTTGPSNKNEFWGNWSEKDAEAIVSTIKGILEGNIPLKVFKKINGVEKEQSPLPGDFALLFRRRSRIPEFLDFFDKFGLAYSLIVDDSLFAQHEISLLIDFLDWFANPHNKHALIHILRSPLIAISDETLRYLASENFRLRTIIAGIEKNDSNIPIDENDFLRLKTLLEFRNDLRWDREGEKAVLIDKIINHGAMDIIFLSSPSSSFETLANLRIFIELVKEWEEDELLSYKEFVYKIKELRNRAFSGKKDYTTIKVGDYESKNSVKILTIHACKGLEFPIVFIPDLIVKDAHKNIYQNRLLLERELGIALKPAEIEFENKQEIKELIEKKGLEGAGGRLIPSHFNSAIFWVHYKRKNNGYFKFDNPLNEIIKKQIAEYWRLFYVACTRARDHLIFHLGINETRGNKYETWMYALQDQMQVLKDTFDHERNKFNINFKWLEENQTEEQKKSEKSEAVEIGILHPSEIKSKPLAFLELDIQGKSLPKIKNLNNLSTSQFIPSTIAARDLYNLIICPRRYAYNVLNRIDNYYLSGKIGKEHLPPGNTPPEGVDSASKWGSIIHQVMENINEEIKSNNGNFDSSKIDNIIKKFDLEEVKEPLEKVLKDYFANKSIKEIYSNKKSSIFGEYELISTFTYEDYAPIIVHGILDLLIKIDEEKWLIIDYKTGTPPDENTDLFLMYNNQVTTYVWLLKQNFLEIKEIEAKIVYLYPELEILDVSYELDVFNEQLTEAIKNKTQLDQKQGFKKKPNKQGVFSRCKTCPYSKDFGGPCDE